MNDTKEIRLARVLLWLEFSTDFGDWDNSVKKELIDKLEEALVGKPTSG